MPMLPAPMHPVQQGAISNRITGGSNEACRAGRFLLSAILLSGCAQQTPSPAPIAYVPAPSAAAAEPPKSEGASERHPARAT
jgi:hypothetical protein